MTELKIEYISPEELTPYENNTRKHAPVDIEQIKKSILEDGFNDPIGIWGDKNIIVEGHGRQIAALELHLEKVPVIRLDHMTDDQRRDYAIRHNRTTELSTWDYIALAEEIAALELEGHNFDGLEFEISPEDVADAIDDNKYTMRVNIPQYEPTGEKPEIEELYDTDKRDELVEHILNVEGITDEEREFLLQAANRHNVFNYKNIAEYYAQSSPEMQQLMEESALVIIDVDDAIALGYARLADDIRAMIEDGDDDEE